MCGELHSSLMLYEADDVQEATTVHNRRLILVGPFWQPRKQVRFVQVWKTLTTVTLWALRNVDVTDFMMRLQIVKALSN